MSLSLSRSGLARLVARPHLAHGLRPPRYDAVSQYDRALMQLRSKEKPLEQYIFLQQLKDDNEELFYQLTIKNGPVRSFLTSLSLGTP